MGRILRESGMDMDHTAQFNMENRDLWTAQGTLLRYAVWQPGGEGVWGRMDPCLCVSPFAVTGPS